MWKWDPQQSKYIVVSDPSPAPQVLQQKVYAPNSAVYQPVPSQYAYQSTAVQPQTPAYPQSATQFPNLQITAQTGLNPLQQTLNYNSQYTSASGNNSNFVQNQQPAHISKPPPSLMNLNLNGASVSHKDNFETKCENFIEKCNEKFYSGGSLESLQQEHQKLVQKYRLDPTSHPMYWLEKQKWHLYMASRGILFSSDSAQEWNRFWDDYMSKLLIDDWNKKKEAFVVYRMKQSRKDSVRDIEQNKDIARDKSNDRNRDIARGRSIDCNRDIARGRSIDRNRDIAQDRSIDRNIDIAPDRSIDRNRDIAPDRSIDRNRDIARDRSSDRNRDIARDRSNDRNRDIARDRVIDRDRSIDRERGLDRDRDKAEKINRWSSDWDKKNRRIVKKRSKTRSRSRKRSKKSRERSSHSHKLSKKRKSKSPMDGKLKRLSVSPKSKHSKFSEKHEKTHSSKHKHKKDRKNSKSPNEDKKEEYDVNEVELTVEEVRKRKANHMALFSILNQLKDEFGTFAHPISILCDMVTKKSNEFNSVVEFVDQDAKALLSIIKSKMEGMLANPKVSFIKKTIYEDALQNLTSLLRDCELFKKPLMNNGPIQETLIKNIAKDIKGMDGDKSISYIRDFFARKSIDVSNTDILNIYSEVKKYRLL